MITHAPAYQQAQTSVGVEARLAGAACSTANPVGVATSRDGRRRAPEGDGRSAHSLRHTATSDVLDTYGNVRIVQEMLGHSSLQSTQVYLRRADLGQLREAMAGRDYTFPMLSTSY